LVFAGEYGDRAEYHAFNMSSNRVGASTRTHIVDGDNNVFRKDFDKAYNSWFQTKLIQPGLRTAVESHELTAEQEKLTRDEIAGLCQRRCMPEQNSYGISERKGKGGKHV